MDAGQIDAPPGLAKAGDRLAVQAPGCGRSSAVASCDIFDFSGGRLSRITSYTIELGGSAE